MTDYPQLLRSVLAGHDLSAEDAARMIGGIMDETISPVRTAALFAAIAAKGESAGEIVGAARAMRERCVRVEHGLPLVLDIVGTGGDNAGTINISTAAALIVAGCGIPVAKHGNRAASSLCGSADVLEALGVEIERDPEVSARLLREARIAFLYARRHHPATRAVGPVRTELGVRTIFNVLGPLTNPAGANLHVVGVAEERHLTLLAEALRELGSDAGAVVHSASGLDEIAGEGPTDVVQFDGTGMWRWTLDPAEFGVRAPLEALRGGDVAVNAAALTAIIEGEQSPRADLVALNAALALVIAGAAENIDEGMERARAAVAGGAARAALDALRGERIKEVAS
ncbi:MAG: anthranilate phosphoribosyltransferase [Candidatus Lustribacter sp.]